MKTFKVIAYALSLVIASGLSGCMHNPATQESRTEMGYIEVEPDLALRRMVVRNPHAKGTVLLLPGLLLIGIGQVLFLVPALMTGASSLKPEHGPTATIVFNMTTVGGTTLAVGLLSTWVSARMALPALTWPAINQAFLVLAVALLLVTPFVACIGRPRPL